MKDFIIYWKTGDREAIRGETARDAFRSAGYHFAALAGVYAIDTFDGPGYTWSNDTEGWVENEPAAG